MPSVSLIAVLALQIVFVVAAFATAIIVLSEQQRSEFRDALDKQLSLQRANALGSVTNPLIERKELFVAFVEQYVNGHNNDKVFASPGDDAGSTDNLTNLMFFYNQFYILPARDPMIQSVTFFNESLTTFAAYNAGGSLAKTNLTGPGAPTFTTWNLWGVYASFSYYLHNETALGCIGPYPLDPALCPTFTQPLDSVTAVGSPLKYNDRLLWSAPGRTAQASSPGVYSPVISFIYGLHALGIRPVSFLCISFGLEHVKPLIVNNIADESSRTAVYSLYYHRDLNYSEYMLISGKYEFDEYDESTFAANNYDYYSAAWRGGSTPDQILNAVFQKAQHMFINTTGSGVIELDVAKVSYVASVARVVDAESGLNWLLTEYTERHVFYDDSDQARMIGIVIGVLAELVVIVSCLLIWVAIRRPLRSLHVAMDLAADMRNDEVVHITPALTEIRDLNDAFKQMNARLLAARPFLPQSLLQADMSHQAFDDTIDGEESAFGSTFRNKSLIHITDHQGTPHSESDDLAESRKPHLHSVIIKEIEFRRVAILSINVLGFHGGIGAQGQATVTAIHSSLARIVEQSTGEERGIVDYFHGDRFVCGFNTARLCGNGARNGAETATKIWNRFQSQHDGTMGALLSVFPLGLAMGLSVGRAAVGNHGTETMQRLATIGGVYTEATRLQEVMCRRVLMGSGSLNPLVAGRCLTMGRVVQDLETSNVHCQILGAVPAQLFLPSAEACNEKNVLSFALARNLAIGRITASDEGDSFAVSQTEVSALSAGPCHTTVLVAAVSALSAVKGSRVADDEWLYEMNSGKQRNPFLEANAALQRLWISDASSVHESEPSESSNMASPALGASVMGGVDSVPRKWLRHVSGIIEGSGSSQLAVDRLIFH